MIVQKNGRNLQVGIPAPNPSYPQEIEYVRGKNLFDINGTTSGTFVKYNNGFKLTKANNRVLRIALPQTYPAGTYTLSMEQVSHISSTTNYFYVNIQKYTGSSYDSVKDGVIINNNTDIEIEIPSNFNTFYFFIPNGETSTAEVTVDDVQLEEGSQATPYLPYNTIEEVVSGKNLFDYSISLEDCWISANNGAYLLNKYNTDYIDVSKTNNGYYVNSYNNTNYRWFSVPITLPKNKELKINIGSSNIPSDASSGTNVKIYGYNSLSANQSGTQVCANYRESFNSGDFNYYTLCFYPYQQGRYLYDIMIIDNDITDDTYEPYITPTSYQLSLGDNKFYGIGDYADELLYDVDEDKVYKKANVGETTLKKGYFAQLYTTTIFDTRCQYVYRSNSDGAVLDNPDYRFFCNKVHKANGVVTNYSGFMNGRMMIIIVDENETLENFQNNIDNAVWYYPLATPTLTEITDTTLKAQVKALYNAHSNNGTTIITSNGNLPMIIKCRGLKGE